MSAKVEAATRAREAARLAARTRKPVKKPKTRKARELEAKPEPSVQPTEDTSGEVDDGG